MKPDSSVLALIPHFRCPQAWLRQSVASLAGQSRPPERIVVADDGSGEPPLSLMREFPQVSLVQGASNVGQYRLMQQVIDETDFDAYLFQDADDWSAPGRLQRLLRLAEATGAELAGSAEVRIHPDGSRDEVAYAPDASKQLAHNPGAFCLLLCTALVSRSLVSRVGGLATGMRICGDYDFILRAHHTARLVNSTEGLYFRRIHDRSLTAGATTGFGSELRMRLHDQLIRRDLANALRVRAGGKPVLRPYATAGPVELIHLAGPRIDGLGRPGPS